MLVMPRLTIDQKVLILLRFQLTGNKSDVTRYMNRDVQPGQPPVCSRQAVIYTIQKWVRHQTVLNLKRENYRHGMSDERIDFLCDYVKKNRHKSLFELKVDLQLRCCLTTISKYLKLRGLNSYVVKKKVSLFKHHREKRVKFCRDHLAKSDEFFERVLYTDEKSIQNFVSGRWCYRRMANESNDVCHRMSVLQDKARRLRLNLYGVVSYRGLAIYFVDKTLDTEKYLRVLKTCTFPLVESLYGSEKCYLIQDNASFHKKFETMEYLHDLHKADFDVDVEILDFPARSPDLNLIENIWALIERNKNRIIMQLGKLPVNESQFKAVVKQAAREIPMGVVRKLVTSARNRLIKVQQSEGKIYQRWRYL